jgi:phosphotransferase system enzyme I (PtsI)
MILLGLSLDELSMNHLAIPKMKMMIQAVTLKESKKLLNKVIRMSSVSEIRNHVEQTMAKRFPGEFSGNL